MTDREPDLSALRLLLVEHDPFACDVAQAALGRLGIADISIAGSGAEALGILAAEGRFGLVVSAWDLLGFDGVELLKSVRSHWPGTGVVMVTSNDQQDQIESALAAGVDAYLIKPIAVESLGSAVADSLTKGAARTAALGIDDISPGGDRGSELDAMFGMLEGILSNVPAVTPDAAIDAETQARLNILMGKLADQLANFVTSYESATPEKLRVMQLHIDFMDAIRAGRTDLVDHESSNMIIDGLKMAIDMASD
jgi:two-component system chemotaxis response regulator CheY